MSSTPWSRDDLTPRAKIRHAALELFGEQGFDRTTIRQIAQRAGVSAPLVIHHFGSKDGLRHACDDWVMGIITSEKSMLMRGGSLPEIEAYLAQHPEMRPIMAYLVTALRQGGELAQGVFDRLCEATAVVLDTGVESGTMREPSDRDALVTTLVAYSTGMSILGDLVAARLGGRTLLDPEVYRRYALASVELFTHGVFTDDSYLQQARAAAATDATPTTPHPEES